MTDVRIPVTFTMPSGDVTQVFSFGQVGLFNVNLGSSAAPEIESDILKRAGSYGRQIGRIADALEVVVGILDRAGQLKDIGAEEEKAIEALRAVQVMVREVKKDHGRP